MPGFDGLTVDHAALGWGAQELLDAVRGVRARLDQLEADLMPLATGWTGTASAAYDAATTRWERAIAEIVALLQEIGAAVDRANADYAAADRRGAGRF